MVAATDDPCLRFGLIFFSSRTEAAGQDAYRLLLESARFADTHGFSSLWVPERHFTPDGWLYPNPSVVAAALARETSRIALRAGSVVVPLHHPVRIAEEWAVVDQLSGGRVGLSFASGWHPDDFVFGPDRYADRHEHMYRGIESVRTLWRGQPVTLPGGDGPVQVRVYPPPVQPELPVWITAAGNPQTFERAGAIGANVLTHLFNQSVAELREKIDVYRDARRAHGHGETPGQVSVMVHTFVSDDAELVDGQVRDAFCDYLKSASYLLTGVAASRGQQVDLGKLSPQDVDEYVRFVHDRMVEQRRVLFGTPESCHDLLRELSSAGVDEIACQLDFGPSVPLVLGSLPALDRLRRQAEQLGATVRPSPPPPVRESAVTTGVSGGVAEVRARCAEQVTGAELYRRLRGWGVEFGTDFQGLRQVWRRDGEALGQVELADRLAAEADAYAVHPAFLDACLQVLIAALPGGGSADGGTPLHLPVGIRRFELFGKPGRQVLSHAVIDPLAGRPGGEVVGDVRLMHPDGTPLAQALGVRLHPLHGMSGPDAAEPIDDLCYLMRWEEVAGGCAADRTPGQATPAAPPAGRWLVFADDDGVADALLPMLAAPGLEPVVVTPVDEPGTVEPQAGGAHAVRWRIRPDSPEDMRRLIAAVTGPDAPPCQGAIHLWSLRAPELDTMDVADLPQAQRFGCGSALQLFQSLAEPTVPRPPRVWLVTRGAQQVMDGEGVAALQAPLWGFGRAAAFEHPALWGGLVDLDPEASAQQAATALRQALDHPDEDELAVRADRRYAARLVRAPAVRSAPGGAPAGVPDMVRCRPDARYLITGGLGDLGLEVARWLADRGARHLVLLGRTGLPDPRDRHRAPPDGPLAAKVAAVDELTARGVDVLAMGVDVAEPAALSACLAQLVQDGRPPIRGVVHAAATVRGGILVNLDQAALTEVLRPKIDGGVLLHRLLAGADLDFFLLFSAIPASFGWLGQGAANYAAANAFLDALAAHRRALGLPSTSIAWGPWAEAGLVRRAAGGAERLADQGIGTLSNAQGRAVLERLLTGDESHTVVASIDWPQILRVAPALVRSPLLRRLIEQRTVAEARRGGAGAGGEELRALPPHEREPWLGEYARGKVAEVLRIPADRLHLDRPLSEAGLDSLMAIELKNRLEADLGVHVPMVTFLQGPSIRRLATEVIGQLTDPGPASSAAPVTVAAGNPARVADGGAASVAAYLDQSLAAQVLADLDRLSDEDVTLMIAQLEEHHDHD
ncbi:bifunctional LLM class flavin-dependent oxidoreductase/SDR family oxidoreductase [Nonomuraea sp. NPDC049607]|uniref:bifunctional LLM class flavin-dependent oxidoreductase/SDR family oxidoreductase n=1 Tax=Nonomuraea sp. NPDC049607 TaxID=3154732 RepID=UPI00343EEB05